MTKKEFDEEVNRLFKDINNRAFNLNSNQAFYLNSKRKYKTIYYFTDIYSKYPFSFIPVENKLVKFKEIPIYVKAPISIPFLPFMNNIQPIQCIDANFIKNIKEEIEKIETEYKNENLAFNDENARKLAQIKSVEIDLIDYNKKKDEMTRVLID